MPPASETISFSAVKRPRFALSTNDMNHEILYGETVLAINCPPRNNRTNSAVLTPCGTGKSGTAYKKTKNS